MQKDVSMYLQIFHRSNPIKIMVHGFSDQGRTGWIQHYRDRYLESADVNVISVHWYNLCTSPWYSTASKNAKYEKIPNFSILH